MQPQQLIRVDTPDETSFTGIESFWKETFGEHLFPEATLDSSENQITFSGQDETLLLIRKTSSDYYDILITSADSRIVSGLTGYIEEVLDELTSHSARLIFA